MVTNNASQITNSAKHKKKDQSHSWQERASFKDARGRSKQYTRNPSKSCFGSQLSDGRYNLTLSQIYGGLGETWWLRGDMQKT